MKLALLLLLLPGVALADDAPKMVRVSPGYVSEWSGWAMNEPGKAKLDAHIQAQAQRIAQLESDKAALAAQPALTWTGAAVLVGVGILLGGAVVLAIKR